MKMFDCDMQKRERTGRYDIRRQGDLFNRLGVGSGTLLSFRDILRIFIYGDINYLLRKFGSYCRYAICSIINYLLGRSLLRRLRKRLHNLLPYIFETISAHIVDLSLLPTLLSHLIFEGRLLRAPGLAQRYLSQSTGDTSL